MRAARIFEDLSLRIDETEKPSPGPGEALVRGPCRRRLRDRSSYPRRYDKARLLPDDAGSRGSRRRRGGRRRGRSRHGREGSRCTTRFSAGPAEQCHNGRQNICEREPGQKEGGVRRRLAALDGDRLRLDRTGCAVRAARRMMLLSKITQIRKICTSWSINALSSRRFSTAWTRRPERLILITGPRQTGKTTLVRQALAGLDRPSRYLAADEPDPAVLPAFPDHGENAFAAQDDTTSSTTGERDARWLVRNWERARIEADRSERGPRSRLRRGPEGPWLVGGGQGTVGCGPASRPPPSRDPAWLGALLMQRGMTESLAGRYETIRLTQWSFAEMSAAFDFDLPRYVYFGGYPGAAPLVREQARWRAYVTGSVVEPNIERDVLAMEAVDKPALLKRLFALGAEYSGQILSYTKMLGQLQDAGNTTTLARYLDLLATAGLVAGLPNYAGSAHRRRASIPKLNVLDTALMSAHSGYTFEEARADRSFWGRLVESAVARTSSTRALPRFGCTTGGTGTGRWISSSRAGARSPQWRSRAACAGQVRAGSKSSAGGSAARPPSSLARGGPPLAGVPVRAGAGMARRIVTAFVPRTCTEIGGDGSSSGAERSPGGCPQPARTAWRRRCAIRLPPSPAT